MGGSQQPFLFQGEILSEDGIDPVTAFNPQAVTRTSWEVKPRKTLPDGPLVSVDRHPDFHVALGPRSTSFWQMSDRTKKTIKAVRGMQLVLRVVELIGGVGILVLMILLSNVEPLTAWVLRITSGMAALSSVYAVMHLSRPATSKTAGSSSAYHTFVGIADLVALFLYAYGALSAHNKGNGWDTLLAQKSMLDYFRPAAYYTLIGTGSCHVVSLAISLYLGIMFRRIQTMPPDINPLETHLPSRHSSRAGQEQHRRNKLSVATTACGSLDADEDTKRMSTTTFHTARDGLGLGSPRNSVPFMHTRAGSDVTLSRPGTRDSRVDLPSRQYQILPWNSPRSSGMDMPQLKHMSMPPLPPPSRTPVHQNYRHQAQYQGTGGSANVPPPQSPPGLTSGSPGARPASTSAYTMGYRPSMDSMHSMTTTTTTSAGQAARTRSARFTEAWYASETLVARTQQRNRAMMTAQTALAAGGATSPDHVEAGRRSAYEALTGRYEANSDSDGGDENDYYTAYQGAGMHDATGSDLGTTQRHPNPLRSNPSLSTVLSAVKKGYAPVRASALSEVSRIDQRMSASGDIADAKTKTGAAGDSAAAKHGSRDRLPHDGFIQPEDDFYSKPYGSLKSRTPPVMEPASGAATVVGNIGPGGRHISSGNDFYDNVDVKRGQFGRRNVSGKIAEEGRSRYSGLVD